ncbi:MAG: hypothetical protein K5839_06465 [Treponemataceae bacterium]|nr:hypothetical protein [Treponemataceae bacterium]
MKREIFLITLILTFFSSLYAQSSVSSSISGLKASLKSTGSEQASIELTWEIPTKNNITSFKIYRDNKQITKESLPGLKPLIELKGRYTRYTDTVTDTQKTYYYCITTTTFEGENFDIIIPMVNSTVVGIKPRQSTNPLDEIPGIEGKVETVENERILTPLPYLNEMENANTDKIEVSKESLETAKKFSSKASKSKAKKIQILKEEKSKASGDQYLLNKIVNGNFKQAKWDKALAEFNDFLKINRPEAIVNRANFYMGQIYYYKGDSKQAIFCFMNSQKECPIESRQWIDEVLNSLSLEK